MTDKRFTIFGRVTHADGQKGVHGITVEAWDKDLLRDDPLGTTLTSADGHYRIAFSRAGPAELLEGEPEVYLKLRDRDGHVVHTTEDRPVRIRTDELAGLEVVLDDEHAERHLAGLAVWTRPKGSLFPRERLSQIATAVAILTPPGKDGEPASRQVVRCPVPALFVFEHVLQDAWGVLQGDTKATLRFRQTLDAVHAHRLRHGQGAMSETERLLLQDDLRDLRAIGMRRHTGVESSPYVSRDHAIPLMMAAVRLGQGDRTTGARYLSLVVDQLCLFELLGGLHHAAVGALAGGHAEREHFRGMWNLHGPEPDLFPDEDVRWPEGDVPLPGHEPGLPPEPEPIPQPVPEPVPTTDIELLGVDPQLFELFRFIDCLVELGASLGSHGDIPRYTIDTVEPSRACPGKEITITGSGFWREGLYVVFHGWQGGLHGESLIKVDPISLRPAEIRVRVPEGAGHGLELGPAVGNTRVVCGRLIDEYASPDIRQDFEGTVAEILSFYVNDVSGFFPDAANECCVQPGDPVEIDWETAAADDVRVEILDENGTILADRNPAAPSGTWQFTRTNYNVVTCLTVRITATGKWCPSRLPAHTGVTGAISEIQREFDVWVYQPPQLSIAGIEVTQAIQRFNITGDTSNNSVRLAGGKRTMVRVYVDSGRTDGFDAGAGANIQPDVTGRMTATNLSTGDTATVDTPLNPAGFLNAPPLPDIDRDQLEHSLNFEIPLELIPGIYDPPGEGFVRLSTNARIKVWVETSGPTGVKYGAGPSDLNVTVHNRTSMTLIHIPCTDNNTGNSPSDDGWSVCVQGARTRFPLGHDAFHSHSAPNHLSTSTEANEDLTQRAGWSNLLDRLEDIAGDYQDQGEIWCIIVPDDHSYALNGLRRGPKTTEILMGSRRFEWQWTHGRLIICKEGRGATFAHELGHTQGIHHAHCPNTGSSPPDPSPEYDDRLPEDGRIRETGVDVYGQLTIHLLTGELVWQDPSAIAQGTGEVMSLCDVGRRWPSVAFWDIIFDRFD